MTLVPSAWRTPWPDPAPEGVTVPITAILKGVDDYGLVHDIPAADISALNLTLYERRTGNIIAGRDRQTILNANGGVVEGATAANLRLRLSKEDMAFVSASGQQETHVLLLEFEWAAGARNGAHEIYLTVIKIHRRP